MIPAGRDCGLAEWIKNSHWKYGSSKSKKNKWKRERRSLEKNDNNKKPTKSIAEKHILSKDYTPRPSRKKKTNFEPVAV